MSLRRHKTQRQQVKEWLIRGHSITALEALRMYGCFRLASVIHRLRNEDNIDIRTDTVERDGKRFARYSMDNEKIQTKIESL